MHTWACIIKTRELFMGKEHTLVEAADQSALLLSDQGLFEVACPDQHRYFALCQLL